MVPPVGEANTSGYDTPATETSTVSSQYESQSERQLVNSRDGSVSRDIDERQSARQPPPEFVVRRSWNPSAPRVFRYNGRKSCIESQDSNNGIMQDQTVPKHTERKSAPQPSPKQEDEDFALALSLQKQQESEEMTRISMSTTPVLNEKEQLIQSLLDAHVDQAELNHCNSKNRTAPRRRIIEYTAPDEIPTRTTQFSHVPSVLLEEDFGGDTTTNACAICSETLFSRLSVALSVCAHIFHLDCIDEHLGESHACPTCHGRVRQDPHGTSPSGTMTVTRHAPHELPPGTACIRETDVMKILYEMPDGYQKEFHNKPGERYRGCTKVAFLPDTEEGRALLERLIYAFEHGLTFHIAPNKRKPDEKDVVDYATIPHRSVALDEKDDKQILYYIACHDELDQLGVPRPNR
jgi:deltex-like protein